MEYIVYWIHHPEHIDMSVQGYVGITSNFNKRMNSHKNNRKKTKLTSAISKYNWDGLDKKIVKSNLTLDEALQLEYELRPFGDIGWNIQRGGELGVESEWYDNPDNKAKHRKATSNGTKRGIANEPKGERARRAYISNRRRNCVVAEIAAAETFYLEGSENQRATKAASIFNIGNSTIRKKIKQMRQSSAQT